MLAAGGLEIARLMLASHDVHPRGIGNERDLVGRYYMCHLAGTIGSIKIFGRLDPVNHSYQLSDEGIYCRRRLALKPDVQREHQLGNFIARLHHPRITDAAHRNAILSALYLGKGFISYEYGRRLHGGERLTWLSRLQHVWNVTTGPLDVAAFAWHMFRDRKLAARKFPSIIIKSKANLYSLDFHAEQQPNYYSRVILGADVDALGMPRLNIDWRYTAGDVDTVQRSLALLRKDFKQSGVGSFDYDPSTVEFEMTRYGAYGGHHIGTARMGNDPKFERRRCELPCTWHRQFIHQWCRNISNVQSGQSNLDGGRPVDTHGGTLEETADAAFDDHQCHRHIRNRRRCGCMCEPVVCHRSNVVVPPPVAAAASWR